MEVVVIVDRQQVRVLRVRVADDKRNVLQPVDDLDEAVKVVELRAVQTVDAETPKLGVELREKYEKLKIVKS